MKQKAPSRSTPFEPFGAAGGVGEMGDALYILTFSNVLA